MYTNFSISLESAFKNRYDKTIDLERNVKLQFEKMHGCGNDFIVMDNTDRTIALSAENIKALCARHTGIGADGLILAEKRGPSYFMNYYNADGTPAEMCGNGMRCTAEFLKRHDLVKENRFTVGSRSGPVPVDYTDSGHISVYLKKADYAPAAIGLEAKAPVLDQSAYYQDKAYRYGCVSMGNPHMIIMTEDLDETEVCQVGAYFQTHPMFKHGANISFAQVITDSHIRLMTWERGDGLTLACGTGTCGAVSVLHENGLIGTDVRADVPGGTLEVKLLEDGVVLTGPARTVFSGEVEVDV